jgi:hypothetical protein
MGMNGEITLVSHKGTGSTRKVKIVCGMTAKEVLYAELGIADPDKLLVVVNGEPVEKPETCKLNSGDFVIIVPKDTKGGS